MAALGGRDIAAPALRLQPVLTHQPPNLLVVHDQAVLTQRRLDAPPAIGFEHIGDRGHRLHKRNVVERPAGLVVIG